MRRVGVAGREPDGHAQRAGDEIGLGERQRVPMRVEDVGVEDVERVGGQRMRHPRHNPDAPAAVIGVDPADVIDFERNRIGQNDSERCRSEDDERGLNRSARTHESRMVASRLVLDAPCVAEPSPHGSTARTTHLAEQTHFWFRGFRSFMRPEVARALDGEPRRRSSTAAAAPARTCQWLSEYGGVYRLRPDVERAHRSGRQMGRTRSGAREHRCDSVPQRHRRSGDVLRRVSVPSGAGGAAAIR